MRMSHGRLTACLRRRVADGTGAEERRKAYHDRETPIDMTA